MSNMMVVVLLLEKNSLAQYWPFLGQGHRQVWSLWLNFVNGGYERGWLWQSRVDYQVCYIS